MKKVLILVMCVGFTFAATAQKTHGISGVHSYGYALPHYAYVVPPRVSVGIGYYPFYYPFYGPWGYYGFPMGYYPYGPLYGRPTTLQRKEDDIRADYADRIYSVKQDNSLTSKEKREQIRALKKERKQAVHDLVVNYHKQPATGKQAATSNQSETK